MGINARYTRVVQNEGMSLKKINHFVFISSSIEFFFLRLYQFRSDLIVHYST